MPARFIILFIFTALASLTHAALSTMQQIQVATFEKMRDVERYQIKIAEKHFLGGDFKIALAEYEKFLTLYEKSPGAPYAQLMWSHTMMNLKKPKTALRDGFQSVIDYWPESHEATIAAYCMGDSYRTMGEVQSAQKAFRFLIKEYPDHEIAVRSRHRPPPLRPAPSGHGGTPLRSSTNSPSKVKRTDAAKATCIKAAHELAELHCFAQKLAEGKKALATTYTGPALFDQSLQPLRQDRPTSPQRAKDQARRPQARRPTPRHPPRRNTRPSRARQGPPLPYRRPPRHPRPPQRHLEGL